MNVYDPDEHVEPVVSWEQPKQSLWPVTLGALAVATAVIFIAYFSFQ